MQVHLCSGPGVGVVFERAFKPSVLQGVQPPTVTVGRLAGHPLAAGEVGGLGSSLKKEEQPPFPCRQTRGKLASGAQVDRQGVLSDWRREILSVGLEAIFNGSVPGQVEPQ